MAYQGIAYDVKQSMKEATSSGVFVSLCTIQQPDGTFGPSGQPSGNYTPVTGLSNIPCMVAVDGSIQATEIKAVQEIMSKGLRHVTLNGFYPTIVSGQRNGWRAVIDGVTYDLIGAEPDSQSTQTRLKVQLVTL